MRVRGGGPAERHNDGLRGQSRDRQRLRRAGHRVDAGRCPTGAPEHLPHRPEHDPGHHRRIRDRRGQSTPETVGRLFDRWPEAVALGEKMDFVQVALGDPRAHAIIQQALRRGLPVSGHVYGQEFVAAYAASGVTDTHEAVSREIADDLLEAGLWVFLRGGPPTTPWHSLPEAVRTITELLASPKRVCVCTDDRDTDDLFHFGLDWVVRQAVAAGIPKPPAWSLGSLHPATRYGQDRELGGLGHGRRADIILLMMTSNRSTRGTGERWSSRTGRSRQRSTRRCRIAMHILAPRTRQCGFPRCPDSRRRCRPDHRAPTSSASRCPGSRRSTTRSTSPREWAGPRS